MTGSNILDKCAAMRNVMGKLRQQWTRNCLDKRAAVKPMVEGGMKQK